MCHFIYYFFKQNSTNSTKGEVFCLLPVLCTLIRLGWDLCFSCVHLLVETLIACAFHPMATRKTVIIDCTLDTVLGEASLNCLDYLIHLTYNSLQARPFLMHFQNTVNSGISNELLRPVTVVQKLYTHSQLFESKLRPVVGIL